MHRPTSAMKVDVLCEFGSRNGGENSMLALLPPLRRRGVRFRVVAPPQGPLADAVRALDVELIPFEYEAGQSLFRRREQLGKLLWQIQSKIVHANSIAMGRIAMPVVADLATPSLVHLRDIVRLNRTAIRDLNRFRRMLAVSEATRRFHVEQGIYARACHVVYNGVDLERFRPGKSTGYLHQELGLPPDARLLAVIGQIGLRKGQDRLIESLSPIFMERPDVHLLVVGRRWSAKEESVRFEREIRQRAEREPFRHRVRDRVHFLGVRDDIPRLLNELTLLVHPARQEPLGRVLLEAAACGVAVVATDVGGTREIFPDSLFTPPFDRPDRSASARIVASEVPGLFQRAVESLLGSEATRRRLGAAARRRVEEQFSSEIAADALFRHYQAVLTDE